jgi:hypothetical protein
MCRHRARRVAPRWHFLRNDPRQLPLSRLEGHELLEGRILDEDDRPIAGFATPPIHGVAKVRFIHASCLGQQVQRALDIFRLFANEGDVPGALILYEDRPIAVEQHPAGCRKWQPPHVIVLRHLRKLVVRCNLEDPERNGQR